MLKNYIHKYLQIIYIATIKVRLARSPQLRVKDSKFHYHVLVPV